MTSSPEVSTTATTATTGTTATTREPRMLRALPRDVFLPADTTPAAREPRTFVAAASTGSNPAPRGFNGLDLTGGQETEAARKVREQARTAGYAAGWAAGMRQAAEKADAELQARRQAAQVAARHDEQQRHAARTRAEQALTGAAAALRAEREPGIGALADTVLELALELAGAVLDREVSLMDSPVGEAVRRALRPLDGEKPVTVRVHPSDLDALVGDAPVSADLKGPSVSADAPSVSYLPDPTVQPGDAIARQGDTEVDAGLRASVARALDALVGGEGAGGVSA